MRCRESSIVLSNTVEALEVIFDVLITLNSRERRIRLMERLDNIRRDSRRIWQAWDGQGVAWKLWEYARVSS